MFFSSPFAPILKIKRVHWVNNYLDTLFATENNTLEFHSDTISQIYVEKDCLHETLAA